ncbi:MAG TPA: hypothetical protein VL426_00085 [Candidatus Binatia bacterium]|nr:hypothetical protein [Candidatus Binatia bacterium]
MDTVTLDLLPHISGFLEKPAKCPAFLVPAAYAAGKLDALKAAGFAPKSVQCGASQHVFDAVVVRFRNGDRAAQLDAALAAVFGHADKAKLRSELCLVPKRKGFFPLVTPKDVSVIVHDDRDPLETEKDIKLRRLALGEYDKSLRTLARFSGLEVHFHAEGGGIKPPFPEKPGVVHILTNAQPPGQISVRYVSLAFGLKIHEEGLAVLANGPSRGRGAVVKDELGESLVQVLGNTWYLLFPTLSHFNWQTSTVIFDKLVSLAWRGSREAVKLKAPVPATRKAFEETAAKWNDELPDLIRADVKNMDRKIEDAQRDLADLTRRKKESLALLEAFGRSTFARELRERAPKDFAAIKADPLVQRVLFVDEGLHVETKPIVIEEEGVRYAMGSFVVRIAKRGAVTAWNEAPTHRGGIPHPHIAKDGGPCFGNATRAIAEAAGEQRYADAVRYVLRWLSEGYTKALAAVKIREWPYVGESPEHYETRYLTDKALEDAEKGPREPHPMEGFIASALQLVKELDTESSESQAPSSELGTENGKKLGARSSELEAEAGSSELEAPQKEARNAADA